MTKLRLLSREARLMGSPFSLQAYIPESQCDEPILDLFQLAFTEIERIENLLTDFRDSPFNEINRMAGFKPVKVPREIFSLVKLALRFSKQSGGAFDISYASVGNLWRTAMASGIPPSAEEIAQAKQYVNFRKIKTDERRLTIFLPHPEMKLGLGGIGKGYAVDRAYHLLRARKLTNFFVNGAGDIRVHSTKSLQRPWRIAIRHPFSSDPSAAIGSVELKTGAIATSGDYERYFEHEGKKYHHIVDGRSGEITREVSSATVFAKDAVTADVYATTIMVLGPKKGLDFLNRRKDISGFLITTEGKTLMSKGMKTTH